MLSFSDFEASSDEWSEPSPIAANDKGKVVMSQPAGGTDIMHTAQGRTTKKRFSKAGKNN
jgi:hypothetical protein